MELNPKIYLANSYSLIYFLVNPNFGIDSYKEFSKNCQAFQTILSQYGDSALNNISKITGIPWHKKEIPVYLIPDQGNSKSFAFPLVLVWRNNPANRFLALVHELVHINLLGVYDELSIVNNPRLEKITNTESLNWLIVKKVIASLSGIGKSEFENEFNLWFQKSEKMKDTLNQTKKLENEFDLDQKPLMEWLA